MNRAYQSAVPDHVWLALQQQVDEEGVVLPTTVKEIMDTWTEQMGFPLVEVTRDYATGSAVVTQVRRPILVLFLAIFMCHRNIRRIVSYCVGTRIQPTLMFTAGGFR